LKRVRPITVLALGLAAMLAMAEPEAAYAAASDRIDAPTEGSTVSGRVEVRGTAMADGPNFRSFRLEFGAGREPRVWRPIGPARDHSVKNGVLGIWESGDLAPGEYTLRLTVVDEAGHDHQSWVRVRLAATAASAPPAAAPVPSAAPGEPAGPESEAAPALPSGPEGPVDDSGPAEQDPSVSDSAEPAGSDGLRPEDDATVGSIIQPPGAESPPLPPRAVRCPMVYYHEVPARVQLSSHLATFLQAGYRPVTMGRLVDGLEGQDEPPPGCLVLTFDDGLASQFSAALPVLLEHGVPATFFVMPNFHDGVHRYMTPRDLRALRDAGMEIGSHTLNHASLPALLGLNYGAFQSEIVNSRLVLEEQLRRRVDLLAYPNGAWDHATASEVARAGYRAAASTVPGAWQRPDDRYWLRRIRADPWEPAGTVLGRVSR
jgi:peptidoglycan/xylan/chitin deacetylase (PgdA/CDA1 family)